MCNAYSLTHARELARQHRLELDEDGLPPDWRPRYRISPRQRAPILRLDPETGEVLETFTVVTTSALAAIRVHDRMPVLVDVDDALRWLEPGAVPKELLAPFPAERMSGWRVVDEARNYRIPEHLGLIESVER